MIYLVDLYAKKHHKDVARTVQFDCTLAQLPLKVENMKGREQYCCWQAFAKEGDYEVASKVCK